MGAPEKGKGRKMKLEDFTEENGFVKGNLVRVTHEDDNAVCLIYDSTSRFEGRDVLLLGNKGQSGHYLDKIKSIEVLTWPWCLWTAPHIKANKNVQYINRTRATVHYTLTDIKRNHSVIKDDFMLTMKRPFWVDL
jgi:hypothetical protein